MKTPKIAGTRSPKAAAVEATAKGGKTRMLRWIRNREAKCSRGSLLDVDLRVEHPEKHPVLVFARETKQLLPILPDLVL